MIRALMLTAAVMLFTGYSDSFAQAGGKRPLYFVSGAGSAAMEKLHINSPHDDIEAVGWSQSGLFAYRYKYVEGSARGNYWHYKFIIINTVNDKIVDEDAIEIEYDESVMDKLSATGANTYREQKARWNELLKKHNISGQINNPVDVKFSSAPQKFPVDGFYCWLDHSIKKVDKGNLEEGIPWVDSVSWKLIVGNDNAQKTISDKKERRASIFDDLYGKRILGYFKNPHANRIAVVLAHHHWTPFCGGDYTATLEVFGCNMNVGLGRRE